MSIEKLLHDYHVPTAQPGDKNYRDGWVNVKCPFCADHSMHLGFNIGQGYAHCWRCGGKFIEQVISKLLGLSTPKAKQVLKQYGKTTLTRTHAKEVKRKIRIKAHKLPSNTTELKTRHKRYLENRGFNPDEIIRKWGVLGTGPLSKLDDISYKHRILAPINWDGEQVSFQTRDITGKHKVKYLACPEDRELIKHKHVLYGKQGEWGDVGIAVEGITDVWRMGVHAFSTFGIAFTHRQIRHMAKHFRRVIIIFDEEPQAQKQAKTLQAELKVRGVEAIIETVQTDPADLGEAEAKNLLRKFIQIV